MTAAAAALMVSIMDCDRSNSLTARGRSVSTANGRQLATVAQKQ